MNGLGKWLVGVGILLVLLGFLAQAGMLSWFGRLPGDLRIERPGFTVYLPITTMIVVSAVMSLLLQLARRFL